MSEENRGLTHHEHVGLPDGPDVNVAIIATGGQHTAGLSADGDAVDCRRMRHKLLCNGQHSVAAPETADEVP